MTGARVLAVALREDPRPTGKDVEGGSKDVARFKRVRSGEWVQPKRRGYKLACCDCGLVHTLNFRLVQWGRGRKIQFQAFRHERSTALMRRQRKPPEATP